MHASFALDPYDFATSSSVTVSRQACLCNSAREYQVLLLFRSVVNKPRWGGGISNSPSSAGHPNAKMKLLVVANRVLLIPPVSPFLRGAEPALEPVFHLLQEPIICLRKAEPMVVIHSVDFVLRQGTTECVCCHSFLESFRDPGDREVLPSSLPG